MRDIDAYRAFIEKHAPYGYGLLFVKIGDFTRAQHALQRALVDGRDWWAVSRAGSNPPPATLMEGLVDRFAGNGQAPAEEASEHSPYSRSQKLQALNGALDLLRSFPEEERLALVLLHVEEVPDADVLSWMGRDSGFLEAVRANLRKRLESWNPPATAENDATSFFLRSLRQYRLSAQFRSTVLHQLARFAPPWALLGRVMGWALVVALPVIVLPLVADSGHRYWADSGYSRPPSYGPVFVLLDLFLALLAFLMRRYLVMHAPRPFAAGMPAKLIPLLEVATLSGAGMILCSLVIGMSPDLSWRQEGASVWHFIHAVWMMGTLSAVTVGAYSITVYYLKLLDARDAGTKDGLRP